MGLLRRGREQRVGLALYGAAVAAARAPYLYAGLGVPDSLDGRFDLVGLHVALLIRRLRPTDPRTAQALFDAMFHDMDHSLREIGVGDLSVAKKVRQMWEAFHGRAAAYDAALAEPDDVALAAALLRNVWRGADGHAPAATTLAGIVRAQAAHLAALADEDLAAGHAVFLPVPP